MITASPVRGAASAVEARLAHQLQLGALLGEADERACGDGSIATTRAPEPAAQSTSTPVRSPA